MINKLLLLSVLSIAFMSQALQADTTWRFGGTIAAVDANLGTAVVPGDAWTMTMIFDENAAPITSFPGGSFYGIISSEIVYYATGGDLTATSTLSGLNHSMGIQNDNGGRDFFTVDSTDGGVDALTGITLNGNAINDFNISFSDFTQTAFSSTAIPATIDLSDFSLKQGRSQFGPSGFDVTYNFSSFEVVPEPSSYAIMFGAIALLCVVGLKHRKQA